MTKFITPPPIAPENCLNPQKAQQGFESTIKIKLLDFRFQICCEWHH